MAIFEDVELQWKGVTYRLAGDSQIMRALAAVEDHVTFAELAQGQTKGSVPLAKLAGAYACLLRHAGARLTDAEVYAGMWEGGADANAIAQAIGTLMELMIPPAALQEAEAGNAPAPAKRGSKSKSKPRTRQRSSAGG